MFTKHAECSIFRGTSGSQGGPEGVGASQAGFLSQEHRSRRGTSRQPAVSEGQSQEHRQRVRSEKRIATHMTVEFRGAP